VSKHDNLVVDPEFAKLLIPLTTDEREWLKQSLKREGCRDPLVAWRHDGKRILMDGHNRKEICEKHGISYRVVEVELESREAAKLWIEEHQAARRNLSEQAKLALWDSILERRSKLAMQERNRQAGKASGKARAKTNMPEPFSDTLDKKAKGCKKKDTRAAVAEEGKISEWKLRGYRAVKNKAVEVLGQQDADNLMLKIRHDEIKLNKAKRYLSQAEHKKKREVAKKSTPDIEEVRKNLHCCSMQDLLGKVRGLDAIVTDPPYPKEYVGLFGELAKLAKKALKPDGVLAVMIGESYLPEILADMTAHMKYRTVMAYLTPGPATALWGNANCNSQFKLILVFGGEKRIVSNVVRSAVLTSDAEDKAFHKWGQSVSGMYGLVKSLVNPGSTVCDPFLGAGTTAVACLRWHCHPIGCDVVPDLVETARNRCSDELEEQAAARARTTLANADAAASEKRPN
jgi:site-specific DNA-methyltransferase (adenine-specific)